MLRRLRLVNYRAFQDFTITFPDRACLVGPNNAGKSTILTSLRLADSMLRVAYSRKPPTRTVDGGIGYNAFSASLTDYPSLQESLRHEFRGHEARLELTWRNGNSLIARWPEPDEYDESPFGYFYLKLKGGGQPGSPAQTKSEYPRLGIVPPLSPIEHSETLLSDEYVRRNISSRLASRHFRNQLHQLKTAGQLDAFIQFAQPWLPGIGINDLAHHESENGRVLDLYISEIGSRVPKEAIWAGDGIQVWLQILFHLYRLRSEAVVVLDEPDVYLHADLQRQLVRLLESTPAQTIVATHSAEIVAETPKSHVVWVEKTRRRASGIKDEALLESLSNSLGSQFNLKLARAMRSRVLLMVEGQDMKLLRRICTTIGALRVAAEDAISVVQLQGYSQSDHISASKWIVKEFLDDAVECFVVLDRDYRSERAIVAVEAKFEAIGVRAHVWRRKELESYLLAPSAIARVSGAGEGEVDTAIFEIVGAMQHDIFSRMNEERCRELVDATHDRVNITAAFSEEFQRDWADPEWRLAVAPPKEILAGLNTRLQASGFKSTSFERLSSVVTNEEIPPEMRAFLHRVDDATLHASA